MGIAKEDFEKSLGRLHSIAKGQLYHTGGDSAPGTWAGSTPQDVDEWDDGIDDNGTDYEGVRKALANKVRKSRALTPAEVAIAENRNPLPIIADKMKSGGRLTQAESWAVKALNSGMPRFGESKPVFKGTDRPCEGGTPGENKDANSVPESHGGKKDSDIEGDASKSLHNAIASQPKGREGLELSPFLFEMVRGIGTALDGTTASVQKSVMASVTPLVQRMEALEQLVAKSFNVQGEFNKSLAEAVLGIGQHVNAQAVAADAQASLPVGPPRSQLRAIPGGQGVQAVEKSFGPGGLENGMEAMQKSQIVDLMADMVKSNQLNPREVIKFEMTGQMNPAVHQQVVKYAKGRGQ